MGRTVALLLSVLLLAGCSRQADRPKTYPVTGKVIDAAGAPLKGGSVQFELDPPVPTDLTVTAIINPDGSFTAKTYRNKDELPGAPEGKYKLTVFRLITDGNVPPPPLTLPTTYRVEAKDNTFDLRIGK